MYTLGGFGGFGNPGSFHNKFVRKLRLRIKKNIIPLFKKIIKNIPDKKIRENTKLEMLFTRMIFRNSLQVPSAETWHRDVVPNNIIKDNDEMYGGWINLDTKSQFFSCVPGSHLGISLKRLKEGFATIPKEHIKQINKYSIKYEIPPGHLIIFPQYIIHEVLPKKMDYDMMRVSIGWRTTISDTFLYSDMLERLKNQSIIPLPSGQLPPLYSKNHLSLFLNRLFKPVPKEEHKVSLKTWSENSIKNVYIDKNISQRFMKSLKDSDLKMYEPYTTEEIKEYLPSKIT